MSLLDHEMPMYLRPDVSIDRIKQSARNLPQFKLVEPVKGPDHADFDPVAYFKYLETGKINGLDEIIEEKTQLFIDNKEKEKYDLIESIMSY